MALINYSSKEITLKIVYYGPGLSGKTTNLQHLHSKISTASKGKLISLATETDRTLFFDFMPVTLGKIGEFTMRFQLYTVPGQVRYNATRKLVLKGADAVVFVADSQDALREQNIESFENMLENLKANNLDPEEIPTVLQYNKRDLDEILSVEELDSDLNAAGHETVEAEAINGKGVDETFQLVTRLLMRHIAMKHKIGIAPPAPEKAAATPPRPKAPPEAATLKTPPPPRAETAPPEAAEPDMPALSEKSGALDSESTFEESNSVPTWELPSMEDIDDIPTEKEVSQEGIGQSISGIQAALEQLARSADAAQQAVSELVAELKESRKNQDEIITLLRKIEDSLRPPGKTAKRA